jgi:hypothetical protein
VLACHPSTKVTEPDYLGSTAIPVVPECRAVPMRMGRPSGILVDAQMGALLEGSCAALEQVGFVWGRSHSGDWPEPDGRKESEYATRDDRWGAD